MLAVFSELVTFVTVVIKSSVHSHVVRLSNSSRKGTAVVTKAYSPFFQNKIPLPQGEGGNHVAIDTRLKSSPKL